ncbi:MAG TPA: aromatic ring-opening dioxygenase subunit LigB [Thermomicrobiales bacterium]|nr:aromatic ring-opening dioxygenase subunit LigB [Thermomicrobiales bacterium]
MPIVVGAVAPHGFPIIPELSEDAEGGLKTRASMQQMQRDFAAAKPDVVVIATPHGFRVNGFISIADCARGAGTMVLGDRKLEMNVPFDLTLADAIVERARAANVPVVQVGYGGSNRNQSIMPMDWGTMTPLWFAGQDRDLEGKGHVLASLFDGLPEDQGPATVVVQPSRLLPKETNIAFGRAVAEAAQADERRIAFIASCDWAHRHDANHPNGYHPDAKRVDDAVVQAIKDDDIPGLLKLDDETISNAAIDGLWQLLMLEGVKQVAPLKGTFLSYEAPTYYGMIVATYAPEGGA